MIRSMCVTPNKHSKCSDRIIRKILTVIPARPPRGIPRSAAKAISIYFNQALWVERLFLLKTAWIVNLFYLIPLLGFEKNYRPEFHPLPIHLNSHTAKPNY
jgi:hypothetical protein